MFEILTQPPQTMADLVLRHADIWGGKTALSDGLVHRKPRHRSIVSFTELRHKTNLMADILTENGIVAGHHLLVRHPLNSHFIVLVLAAWQVGAVLVLPDPLKPEASIRQACLEMPIRAIIGTDRFYWTHLLWGRLGEGRSKLVLSLNRLNRQIERRSLLPVQAEAQPKKNQPKNPDTGCAEQAALITLALNQQGYLCGIERSHQQILDTHASLTGVLDIRPDEKCYANMLLPMLSVLAEAGIVLVPEYNAGQVAAHDPLFWDQIGDHAATSLLVSSSFLDSLAAMGGGPEDHRLNSLDRILSFGSAVFPDVQDRLSQIAPWCRIDNIYTSEAAGPIASTRLDTRMADDNFATSVGRGLLLGRPLAEYQIAILPDDFGMPLGGFSAAEFSAWLLRPGETGEIVVSCDYDMPVFWQGRGEFENAVMVDDRRWYRTGDAGFLDSAGRLWHQGRCQARIADKVGMVYPMAIEAAARAQIGPMTIACINWNAVPVLVVERNRNLDHESLHDVLSATGIGRIVLIDKIPMDKHRLGRVDYRRLSVLLHSRRDLTLMDAGDEPVR